MQPAKERARNHMLSLIFASTATRYPFEEPVFFSRAGELHRLNARTKLTPIERGRREWLREQRELGAIAEAGETWDAALAAAGYRPLGLMIAAE
jgi:hypothetical protein